MSVRVTAFEVDTPFGTFRLEVFNERVTPEVSTCHWIAFEVEGLKALVPAYCTVIA